MLQSPLASTASSVAVVSIHRKEGNYLNHNLSHECSIHSSRPPYYIHCIQADETFKRTVLLCPRPVGSAHSGMELGWLNGKLPLTKERGKKRSINQEMIGE